ncbi:MAG: hypothetical protein ACI4L9_00525 [Candidatus Coproplasma sp.]
MNGKSIVQDDILRYKKNKFASSFALLGLVFNCLYFMLFYSVSTTPLYKILLGGSVILNLLVLLGGFYASEGIKGYNKKFSYVLFVLAAIQIARIFIYPTIGMANDWLTGNYYFAIPMNSISNGVIFIVYLAASAACFIVSGVQGFIVANRLEVFQAKIDNGEVSVEAALKELDEEETAVAESEPASVEDGEVSNG